jgi:hypothetical protein
MKTTAAILVTLVLAQHAMAQVPQASPTFGGQPGVSFPIVPVPPGFGARLGPDYHHASTALEGAMRGVAEIQNASANQALGFSAAQINFETARRMQMEDRVRNVETYWAARNAWQANRNRELAQRRNRTAQAQPAASKAATAASPTILGNTAGEIAWPTWLLGEERASYRRLVEAVSYRELSGNARPADYARLAEATDGLLADLRNDVTQIRGDEYVEAKRFLERLALEARNARA